MTLWCKLTTLHKKWTFPLRIFSVNVTKSAVCCGFGHIYWRNPDWETSFFSSVFRKVTTLNNFLFSISGCSIEVSRRKIRYSKKITAARKWLFRKRDSLKKQLFWRNNCCKKLLLRRSNKRSVKQYLLRK